MAALNTELAQLAPDLSRSFPRSPRETLGGFVIAARTLDKCRAVLAGTDGDYLFNCPLDRVFFEFAGIDAEAFRDLVATGASDEQVGEWLKAQAAPREAIDVIRWNNRMREMRISELPDRLQIFLEDYVPTILKPGKVVHVWFDVYDIEEGRL